jgi:peptidoglycan/LPS O-acetylase OafA/YrhL
VRYNREKNIVSFNISRAILSIGIMTYHLYLLPVGFGQAIMECFFVLSGFLISKSLFPNGANSLSLEKRDIMRFWGRRIKRLGPALWIFIIISIVLSEALPDKKLNLTALLVGLSGPIWISNFLTISAVSESSSIEPFGGIWSLAIEEQFYLILPLFFSYIASMVKRPGAELRTALLSLAAVVLLSYMGRVYAYIANLPLYIEAYSILYRTLGFAFGVGSYFLSARENKTAIASNRICNLLITGTVAAMLLLCFMTPEFNSKAFILQWAIVPLLMSLLCALLYNNHLFFDRRKKLNSLSKGINYIGQCSYSIYLYHPLAIYLVGIKTLKMKIAVFIVSIILAVFSYEFCEKRLTRILFGSKSLEVVS